MQVGARSHFAKTKGNLGLPLIVVQRKMFNQKRVEQRCNYSTRILLGGNNTLFAGAGFLGWPQEATRRLMQCEEIVSNGIRRTYWYDE